MQGTCSGLLWLALGYRRRSVLHAFFRAWQGFTSLHFWARSVLVPDSLEERLRRVLALATPAWSPRSALHRHLLNKQQNRNDDLLLRVFCLWHSTALLLRYRRGLAQDLDAGLRPEPDAEPAPQPCSLAHICTELRPWFLIVEALEYFALRCLRSVSPAMLRSTSTAQRRPNFISVAGRPALLWLRGCVLPTLICIAQPAPGDEDHPRALLDFLD